MLKKGAHMKAKNSLFLLSAATLSLFAASCSAQAKTIAIVQLMTHTSLNEINTAITKTIDDAKLQGYKIAQYNPEGDSTLLSQTMAQLNQSADIVVAITTPVAQSAYNKLSEQKPIVFAACSDPIGAGLVSNLEKPGGNVTGTSDAIQVASILDKALLIDPELDELGFIYNPAEANSVSNKAKTEAYCEEKGIALRSVSISSAGEMKEIAASLISRVDAIFVTDDNTVASAMTVLGETCREAGKPCYVGADSMVKDGGMFSIGINYTTLGTQTASMALDILGGKKVSEVPVKVFNDNLNLYLNVDYAEEAGITIPDSILNDPMLKEIRG